MRHPVLIRGLAARPSSTADAGSVIRAADLPRHPLRLPGVRHCLAIARNNPFWFRPSFADRPENLACRDDIALLLWERTDGLCVALLPLVGEHGRVVLRVDAKRGLTAAWAPDRAARTRGDEAAFALASNRDPFAAIAAAVAAAQQALGTFRRREEKPAPAFIDRLGWCTWDAFYQEVSAAGIARGLAKLAKGGVHPGFLIIDDGWQSVRDRRMHDFATDTRKFPRGLAPVVRLAKEKFGVGHVGVWHTLQGYWQGVDPRGPLARRYRIVPCRDRAPEFIGWSPQFDTTRRTLVAPDDVARFYQDFHRWLRTQGVDFVKVDNQAMLQQFAGKKLPRIATQAAYQRALQGATSVHFGGALLHCMSNVTDVLLHLSTGALWRNSDDFYPKKSDAHQAVFVTANAYNNLLTAPFAVPDWDMFQTTRHHAHYHATARAISGGPVYISDAPGKHDFRLLRRLSLPGGAVPRWPQPARPARDSLFVDPRAGTRLLKVVNTTPHAGAVALFHTGIATEDKLRDTPITDSFSPADLPGLPGTRFVALGSESNRVLRLTRRARATVTLIPLSAETFTIAPEQHGVAALGLAGMLNAGATVRSAAWNGPRTFAATLTGGGTALFFSVRPPRRVTVDGRAVRPRRDARTGLLQVRLPARPVVGVTLEFKS